MCENIEAKVDYFRTRLAVIQQWTSDVLTCALPIEAHFHTI